MSDQVIDDDTPTSSQPSSPQENPFIAPLTFQVHPSALPFNLNSGSPNFFSQPFPATVIQPTSFGSSFNSMASLSQTEKRVSPTKKNSRETTKAQKGKAQSSSTRKATTSKILKVPKSQCKKKNKKQTAKEADDVVSARKAPVYWEDEKNEKGQSAMSVLLNWITTYGNWSRYKSLIKTRTVEEIIDYLAQHGFHGRTVKNMQGKISELEKKFIKATRWLEGTGKGVMDNIEAEKQKEGWSDDNPEYLARKKSLIEDYIINHEFKYYYQVEHIMGTRDKATRLDGASSAAPNPANTSLDCFGMSSKRTKSSQVTEIMEPTTRNDDDHSQASNEEYYRQQAHTNQDNEEFNHQMRCALEDEFEEDETHSQHDDLESSLEQQRPPVQTQNLHHSSSAQTSRSHKTNKQGAETQVTQLLSQPDTETKSAITRLEDVFIKSELENTVMKDMMKDLTDALIPNNNSKSFLTKDEQVEQAQVAAKLKKCQLEAAQLDVQKTKRSMELELAIAKGQFISQLMKDNNIGYEQAKLIADDLYKSVEQTSQK